MDLILLLFGVVIRMAAGIFCVAIERTSLTDTASRWAGRLERLLHVQIPSLGDLQRRRRERKGLCLSCGYDLRATLDRCPECGETFTV